MGYVGARAISKVYTTFCVCARVPSSPLQTPNSYSSSSGVLLRITMLFVLEAFTNIHFFNIKHRCDCQLSSGICSPRPPSSRRWACDTSGAAEINAANISMRRTRRTPCQTIYIVQPQKQRLSGASSGPLHSGGEDACGPLGLSEGASPPGEDLRKERSGFAPRGK